MRITTVFLSYRRAILIAVYTHLLRASPLPCVLFYAFSSPFLRLNADHSGKVLDGGSQTWWRWVNIALLLSVWSLELLLDAEGDDTDSVTRWKVD